MNETDRFVCRVRWSHKCVHNFSCFNASNVRLWIINTSSVHRTSVCDFQFATDIRTRRCLFFFLFPYPPLSLSVCLSLFVLLYSFYSVHFSLFGLLCPLSIYASIYLFTFGSLQHFGNDEAPVRYPYWHTHRQCSFQHPYQMCGIFLMHPTKATLKQFSSVLDVSIFCVENMPLPKCGYLLLC